MNAVNALFREQQEARIEKAIAAAARWVDVARPLILEYIALDEAISRLCRTPHQDEDADLEGAVREGRAILNRAMEDLYREIEAIRDNVMGDAVGGVPASASEADEDARCEVDEAVGEATIKVEPAIARIEREGRLAA